VERGVVNCTGPNKSFDRTRSEEERNSAVFDVNGHVVGFGEATKEKMKGRRQKRRRLIGNFT
jgi:predicted RNA-binding protein with PUA domain